MSTGSSQTGRLQQTGSPGAPAETTVPPKSHGSADLMVLEALLADREVVQCHWQVPIGESHPPPLGFWSKVQTSCMENECTFEHSFWLVSMCP